MGNAIFSFGFACLTEVRHIVFDGMVEKPLVSVFQNFLWTENQLNIKKVICRNVWMCFVSTVSTYIVFEAIIYRVE